MFHEGGGPLAHIAAFPRDSQQDPRSSENPGPAKKEKISQKKDDRLTKKGKKGIHRPKYAQRHRSLKVRNRQKGRGRGGCVGLHSVVVCISSVQIP